jgi:hypothetical protein
MKWLQLAFLIIRMLWKYGPAAWKLGNNIYRDVESRTHSGGDKLTSEESAKAFNDIVVTQSIKKYGEVPKRPELNKFREHVWKRNNIGKTAKRLRDPRLRVK